VCARVSVAHLSLSVKGDHKANSCAFSRFFADTSSKPYEALLASPTSKFFETCSPLASNIAVVCESITPGSAKPSRPPSWDQEAQEIQGMMHGLITSADRLHALFVREHQTEALLAALRKCGAQKALPSAVRAATKESLVQDHLLHEQDWTKLESSLQSAKAVGRLLVLPVKSLDRAFDALVALRSAISQFALLGPTAAEYVDYVSSWIPTRLVSVEFIFPTQLAGTF
jgi:hypothetical protein